MSRKKMGVAVSPVILLISAGMITTTVLGCGNKPNAVAVSTTTNSNQTATTAGDDPVLKFLTALEAQPADKRNSFVNAHQNEANMASQSKDPKISQRFYSLMMPKMVMPNQ